MSLELAKNIIIGEFDVVRDSENFNELEIDFMGGEPFINFKLIKEIIEWLIDLKSDIPWIAACSTNGTLLDDNKRNWLKEHSQWFIPGLSYDGNIIMQKQNRGTSKGDIDVDFFKDTWPTQNFHMTISKDTLPKLADEIISLQKSGYPIEAALAQEVKWTDIDARIYLNQLRIIGKAYIENDRLIPINLLSRQLVGIFDIADEIGQDKFCGTGTNMITYDLDGRSYPCQIFSPIVTGANKELELKNSEIKKDCPIDDPGCVECLLRLWCPTCYGFNYKCRCAIHLRDKNLCNMIKAQAISSCEFQLAYYRKHADKITANDMKQIKGAVEACRVFSKHLDAFALILYE